MFRFTVKHVRIAGVAFLLVALTSAAQPLQHAITLTASGGEVTCVGFTSDAKTFFSGALDSYVSIWTAKDWKRFPDIEPPPPPKAHPGEHEDEFRELTACAMEPNSGGVVIASGGDSVATYSLPSGKEVSRYELPATALAISSDGSESAVGSGSNVSVFAVSTWNSHGSFSAGGEVETLHYAPSSKLIAVALRYRGVQLWDTNSHTLVRTLSTQGSSEQMSFSPDGRLLAAAVSGSGQQTWVQVWEVATGLEVARLSGHKDDVWGVAFSPDGKFIASADTSGVVKLWKVAGWKNCLQLQASGGQQVAISPDGLWLAAGGGRLEISVWDFRRLAESCR